MEFYVTQSEEFRQLMMLISPDISPETSFVKPYLHENKINQ